MIDGVIHDGLWDPYNNQHMGMCGEACAERYGFSRKDQDEYALQSYTRASAASTRGFFAEEIVPVEVSSRGKTKTFTDDEEILNTSADKITSVKSAFMKNGTVTAANASSLNDGAAAMVLMSSEKAKALGLKPLARIRGALTANVCFWLF